MRFIYFGLAFALFAFSASAQNNNDGAAHSSVTVLVNGQPIRGTVLEVDGKHFVAVEDRGTPGSTVRVGPAVGLRRSVCDRVRSCVSTAGRGPADSSRRGCPRPATLH